MEQLEKDMYNALTDLEIDIRNFIHDFLDKDVNPAFDKAANAVQHGSDFMQDIKNTLDALQNLIQKVNDSGGKFFVFTIWMWITCFVAKIKAKDEQEFIRTYSTVTVYYLHLFSTK